MKRLFVLLFILLSAALFAGDRCARYNIGDTLPNYLLKDGYMVPVCQENFSRLGILVRVDAAPDAGKLITRSHGELTGGEWREIIDEQLTQAEIDARNPATALEAALAAEIASLNTLYPELNLTVNDTLATAIPKLFAAGVTKAEANYLNTLYQAIKAAGK
ncbi:MAG: hypothetical protein WCV67_03150 [Victivallaceae bacterium]|jgi:hypothetical protein